jgi:NADH:ubiquinone oxidoreductase subunit E
MAHLNETALARIREICDSYAQENTPLIMILSDIQNEFGYIPVDVQEAVSNFTGISVPEIHGVVTFYSLFSQEPKGKYVIGCCLGTACYVKGAQQVIDQFCEILGIQPGGTTKDGLFSIDALRCLGACAAAPAVTINGKIYSRVKVNEVAEIVAEYRQEGGAL